MPGGDRTGPRGLGPMTGRRAGYCAGFNNPGYASGGGGFGMRNAGWGGRRGFRHVYYDTGLPYWARPAYPSPTPEQEVDALKNQAQQLQTWIDEINQRISQLGKESSDT